jgi:hypothetical protein
MLAPVSVWVVVVVCTTAAAAAARGAMAGRVRARESALKIVQHPHDTTRCILASYFCVCVCVCVCLSVLFGDGFSDGWC